MRDLKQGDTGDDVRKLQELITHVQGKRDFETDADGVFGPATDYLVRKFQAGQGPDADPTTIYTEVLVVDGIVGPKTMASLIQAYDVATQLDPVDS
jgi:peptidoglycan hydrolase-like protein with peptidoglycan-binding domain